VQRIRKLGSHQFPLNVSWHPAENPALRAYFKNRWRRRVGARGYRKRPESGLLQARSHDRAIFKTGSETFGPVFAGGAEVGVSILTDRGQPSRRLDAEHENNETGIKQDQ